MTLPIMILLNSPWQSTRAANTGGEALLGVEKSLCDSLDQDRDGQRVFN